VFGPAILIAVVAMAVTAPIVLPRRPVVDGEHGPAALAGARISRLPAGLGRGFGARTILAGNLLYGARVLASSSARWRRPPAIGIGLRRRWRLARPYYGRLVDDLLMRLTEVFPDHPAPSSSPSVIRHHPAAPPSATIIAAHPRW